MTKRTLYAVAEFGVTVATLLAVFSGADVLRASGRQSAACASCIAVGTTSEALASLPPQLDGLEVFVRFVPGAGPTALEALTEIERRGGRPCLLLDGAPGEAPPTNFSLGRAVYWCFPPPCRRTRLLMRRPLRSRHS